MNKHLYIAPFAEIKSISGENIICASGTNGSNEDFGKGAGLGFDLFETLKPF